MIEAPTPHKTLDTLVTIEGLPEDIFAAEHLLKVVQLMIRHEKDELPVLVFGPAANQHGNHTARYLLRHGIPFEIDKSNTPRREGEQYRMIGAGYASVDPRVQICTFHGGSLVYHLEINKEHIERVASKIPLPKGWQIMIDQ
ncbi:hypothetical protein HYS47_00390 [Candidatus Woesearchaeota archaeon]|nr:hypothetical protein [Candidatus Woesearchaeota archaeon]